MPVSPLPLSLLPSVLASFHTLSSPLRHFPHPSLSYRPSALPSFTPFTPRYPPCPHSYESPQQDPNAGIFPQNHRGLTDAGWAGHGAKNLLSSPRPVELVEVCPGMWLMPGWLTGWRLGYVVRLLGCPSSSVNPGERVCFEGNWKRRLFFG